MKLGTNYKMPGTNVVPHEGGTNCQMPGTNVEQHGAGYEMSGARDECGATWRWVRNVRCQGRL